MRTGKLYRYQLLLLAFAFAIEAPIAAHGNTPAVHNLLDFYFAASHPRAFIDAALMIYRPPLLDILPIDIILIALTPFAVILGERLGWRYALAEGVTLWLFAQFGFRSFVALRQVDGDITFGKLALTLSAPYSSPSVRSNGLKFDD